MSINIMQAAVLICDGCQSEIGSNGEYRSAMEARAAGFALGWRYPGKVRADGKESSLTSDVCGNCISDWQPTTRSNPHNGRRHNQYRSVDQTT